MKISLYITLCVCLIIASIYRDDHVKLETLGSGEFAIYSTQDIQSPLVDRRIQTGLGFIYFTHSSNANQLRQKFTQIDGESIRLDRPKTSSQIFRLLNFQKLCNNYGFSNKMPVHITANGQRINLQVSNRNGVTTVGWPVILGSF